MKKPILYAAIIAMSFAASGCKQKVAEPAATPPAANDQQEQAPAAPGQAKLPVFASPARIAEIKASGRTGFWAEPATFCPGKRTAVLTWNVEASGAGKVIVYVVGKDGQEHHFGRGGPVGERQTGPWLQPGLTFKLRNADGGAELGSITISKAASC
jgi:hypothetical protein